MQVDEQEVWFRAACLSHGVQAVNRQALAWHRSTRARLLSQLRTVRTSSSLLFDGRRQFAPCCTLCIVTVCSAVYQLSVSRLHCCATGCTCSAGTEAVPSHCNCAHHANQLDPVLHPLRRHLLPGVHHLHHAVGGHVCCRCCGEQVAVVTSMKSCLPYAGKLCIMQICFMSTQTDCDATHARHMSADCLCKFIACAGPLCPLTYTPNVCQLLLKHRC